MNDIFNEQLVKRETTKKVVMQRILMILIAIVGLGIVSQVEVLIGFFIPISIGVIFLVFVLVKRTNKEFEYIVTNDELDFDIITNQSSRKRALTIDIRSIEIMALLKDKKNDKSFNKYNKTYDFSSGAIKENTYVFLYRHKDNGIKVIFEPNEKIYKAIKRYIPNKIQS